MLVCRPAVGGGDSKLPSSERGRITWLAGQKGCIAPVAPSKCSPWCGDPVEHVGCGPQPFCCDQALSLPQPQSTELVSAVSTWTKCAGICYRGLGDSLAELRFSAAACRGGAGGSGSPSAVEREWSGHASGPRAVWRANILAARFGGRHSRRTTSCWPRSWWAAPRLWRSLPTCWPRGRRTGTAPLRPQRSWCSAPAALRTRYETLAAGVGAVAVVALAERAASASSSAEWRDRAPGGSSLRRPRRSHPPTASDGTVRSGRRDPASRAVDRGPDLRGSTSSATWHGGLSAPSGATASPA